MIERLQYITRETSQLTHIDCVREACIEGTKWIQLRVKNKSDEEYLTIAREAKIICDLYDVKLIINDNVEVARKIKADGVHLGRKDMSPVKAREILGRDFIIGATATTYLDIENLKQMEVDYIGLGPYQYTETKKDLSELLGISGYENVMKKLSIYANQVPIIAIGGIGLEDVKPLMNTGIYGIAVSATITNDFTLIKDFQKILNKQITNSIL